MQYTYPPPNSTDPFTTAEGEKFKEKSKYNDIWAAILFALVVVAFGICAFFGVDTAREELENNNDASTRTIPVSNTDLAGLVLVAIGGGFVLSIIYFMLMKKFAGTMIKIQAVLFLLAMAAYCAFFFLTGSFIGGIIIAVITIIYAVFLYSWRKRIPFAKVLLKNVLSVITQYPSTIFAGIIGTLLETAVGALFLFTAFGWITRFTDSETSVVDARGRRTSSYNSSLYGVFVFLLFAFYWMTQVIKTTVHVTVSGLFASYYFQSQPTGDGKHKITISNPTAKAAKRALTTSFGSVCYGSLIVAILQTIRALIRMAANQAAADGNLIGYFCAMCAGCILGLIENLVRYFNVYAYTQVAIYGKDYCSAAKATWALVKRRGVDAIINDNLIGIVILMGSVFIGLICGGISYGYYVASSIPKDNAVIPIVIVVLSALIGAAEFAILGEVIESGVATTFVCLCEDPAVLRESKPELYDKIVQVYPDAKLEAYY
ncbi:MAG: hypothetical protein SGCHY_002969 [Lobulomycetales sp.]